MTKQLVAALALAGVPLAALAQSSPSGGSSAGIQVTGNGMASAPVTTVVVRLTAPVNMDGTARDLLDRVKAAGVADAAIDETGGPMRPAILFVHGHLNGVTRAKLDAVTQAAAEYSHAHYLPSGVGVHFFGLSSDCPAIEARARDAALADARRRAGAIAAASNVRLGDTLSVNETGGCARPGPFGGSFAIDTSALTMSVSVNETVTFAVAK